MKYKDFLKDLKGCPFCDGKNNKVIKESEKSYVTYSLWPYHTHHLLVIPKRHVESLQDLTAEEREDIDIMQEKALEALKQLGYASITQLVREGNVVNKTINHVHFHTIPNIRIGDLDHFGQERKILTEEEIEKTILEVGQLL